MPGGLFPQPLTVMSVQVRFQDIYLVFERFVEEQSSNMGFSNLKLGKTDG